MTDEKLHTFVAGDAVYVANNSMDSYEEGVVVKSLKTQFVVAVNGRETRYDARSKWTFEGITHFQEYGGRTGYRYHGKYCYPHTPAAQQHLQERKERELQRREEKDAADKLRREQREAREAAEFAAVRAACNDELPIVYKVQKEDGSRVYVLEAPVHPEYAERKKSWEMLFVVCRQCDSRFRGEDKPVESAYSYQHGGSSSFASVSTGYYATDDEALWDTLRREYHSW